MKWTKKLYGLLFLAASLGAGHSCSPGYVTVGAQYSNPPWAPPYYAGVRYYYIPDLELYFDLSSDEFIYLYNGQWLFSTAFPGIYQPYDLNAAFVIALDVHVFQPWMHHQYYLAHYPRYYYKSYYRSNDLADIRGFNENGRRPFYWKPDQQNRNREDRRWNNPVQRPQRSVKPQPPNYYGRDIGRPVRVKPQMKERPERKKGKG